MDKQKELSIECRSAHKVEPAGQGRIRHRQFFFSSRRRHTRSYGGWSSDVCSSDLEERRVEADVLKCVVVNPVIHDAAAAANYNLLRPQNVPSKANPRPEVVGIFIPEFVVTGLDRRSRNSCVEGVIPREEWVPIYRRYGSYR